MIPYADKNGNEHENDYFHNVRFKNNCIDGLLAFSSIFWESALCFEELAENAKTRGI